MAFALLLSACGSAFSSASDGGSTDASTTAEGGTSEGGGSGDGGGTGDGAGAAEGSSGDAGPGDGASDASTDGGGADGPSTNEAGATGTYCGPSLTCTGLGGQQGTVCCVSTATPPSYDCASVDCSCSTQLSCTDDDGCPGQHCCIDEEKESTCAAGHYVSQCAAVCTGGHLCNPVGASGQCLVTQTCSENATSVGLPDGEGFGLCK